LAPPTGIFDIDVDAIAALGDEDLLQKDKPHLVVEFIVGLIEDRVVQLRFIRNNNPPELEVFAHKEFINSCLVECELSR